MITHYTISWFPNANPIATVLNVCWRWSCLGVRLRIWLHHLLRKNIEHELHPNDAVVHVQYSICSVLYYVVIITYVSMNILVTYIARLEALIFELLLYHLLSTTR